MSTSARIQDMSDLLKLLTQSTQDTTPDNPAEQLSDYVAAPAVGTDLVAITDGVTLPFPGHSGTYVWNDPTTASRWGRSQWS